jgi:predicted nuclease of predicted toxin-antitoxin system
VKHLSSTFQDSKQVRLVGLEDASDDDIFNYAKTHGFSIVTFDSDFIDLNTMRGIPPKIIWLRTGNLTTKSIAELLAYHVETIEDFLRSEVDEILEVSSSQK